MNILVWLVPLICAVLVSGCDASESTRVKVTNVRVLKMGGECMVSENCIPCDSTAAYLKQQLRLSSDAVISVNPETVGNPERHVRDVAAQLQAGFENVAVVGFVTLPEPNNALQRTLEDSRR